MEDLVLRVCAGDKGADWRLIFCCSAWTVKYVQQLARSSCTVFLMSMYNQKPNSGFLQHCNNDTKARYGLRSLKSGIKTPDEAGVKYHEEPNR